LSAGRLRFPGKEDIAMHNLVPAPELLEELPGSCELSHGLGFIYRAELKAEAGILASWLEKALGPELRMDTEAGKPLAPDLAGIELALDPGLGDPEAYRLEILPGRIALTAADPAGIIRGAASLGELALSSGPRLPCLRIVDRPRFAWRGFMLDCARNFFTVDFIEKLIDLAAMHKLNVFHWHLVDDQAWRLELESLPELARQGSRRLDIRNNYPCWKGGSYSSADIRRVVAFAAARHVSVVPEIEAPGHALALLASHPELSCRGGTEAGGAFHPVDRYGVFNDILCAGKDGSLELLGRVIDELATLFPGGVVHMGGDEAPKERWLNCPSCRARMKALGLRDPGGAFDPELLQAWFMGQLAEKLAAKGRRMGGWDEVLEGGVRKDTLIFSWRGYPGGIAGAKAGYDVVMCPQTSACYLDHQHLDSAEEPGQLGVCTVRDSYAFEPVPDSLSPEEARHIVGGQANIWTELMYFSRQVEYMAFPRLCAISEVLWSPKEKRDFEDFSRRLPAHVRRLEALGVNCYRGALW
jgi:hexosaminidase